MTLNDIVIRVRSYTRDTTGTLFSFTDVQNFANEAIDRLRQIKALEKMKYLNDSEDVPNLLPSQYHYAIAVYSASRCYTQDEQHYLAQTFSIEFEGLYALLELGIKEETIKIIDEEGNTVFDESSFDSVKDVYFEVYNGNK